jgi:hypothetical protein
MVSLILFYLKIQVDLEDRLKPYHHLFHCHRGLIYKSKLRTNFLTTKLYFINKFIAICCFKTHCTNNLRCNELLLNL